MKAMEKKQDAAAAAAAAPIQAEVAAPRQDWNAFRSAKTSSSGAAQQGLGLKEKGGGKGDKGGHGEQFSIHGEQVRTRMRARCWVVPSHAR